MLCCYCMRVDKQAVVGRMSACASQAQQQNRMVQTLRCESQLLSVYQSKICVLVALCVSTVLYCYCTLPYVAVGLQLS